MYRPYPKLKSMIGTTKTLPQFHICYDVHVALSGESYAWEGMIGRVTCCTPFAASACGTQHTLTPQEKNAHSKKNQKIDYEV